MTTLDLNDPHALDELFQRLHRRVAAAATPIHATQIIARGQRRRRATLALSAVGIMAMIALGYAAIGWPGATPPPPAGSTSLPSATPEVPSGSRIDVSDTIPVGFLLHETAGGERGGGRINERCFGHPTAYAGVPHDVGEGAARVTVHHELYVYDDPAAARAVLHELQADLAGCLGFPQPEVLSNERPDWGDEALAVTIAWPADGAGEHAGQPLRMVALRVGKALAVFSGGPGQAEVDADARAVVPRLCLYDPDCRPSADLPASLTTLPDGGSAWVAVLHIIQGDDSTAPPGVAIAAAAELGYHATLVPVACDQGAAPALQLSDPDAHYVAVYFDSQKDATALAAALPALQVWTLPVRTQCL
jgi:hypothetical protein